VNGFSSLPRISQGLVSTSTNVGGDQRIHSFGSYIGCRITRLSNLSHLGIEHSLLVRVYLEGCENVDLLDEQKWSILLSHFKSDFCK